jgi:hypothetical protein
MLDEGGSALPVEATAEGTCVVEVATRVFVPGTEVVAVITTDPNWQGRVRVDWDEGKIHHYRFIKPEELVEVPEPPEASEEPEVWQSPHLVLSEPPVATEEAWVEPWMDLS